MFLLLFELSIIFGFLLDLLFADPAKLPHPVVIIGKGITLLERNLRNIFPKSPGGERAAGRVMAALIVLTTFVVTMGLCILAWIVHPIVFLLLHTLWCWQAIAVRGLANEAKNVYSYLSPECDIEGARKAADALDEMRGTERGYASVLSSYLNFCKALGIVPTAKKQQPLIVGDGKLAKMRAGSRASLRAV